MINILFKRLWSCTHETAKASHVPKPLPLHMCTTLKCCLYYRFSSSSSSLCWVFSFLRQHLLSFPIKFIAFFVVANGKIEMFSKQSSNFHEMHTDTHCSINSISVMLYEIVLYWRFVFFYSLNAIFGQFFWCTLMSFTRNRRWQRHVVVGQMFD